MEFGWAQYALILLVGTAVPIFIFLRCIMKKSRFLAHGEQVSGWAFLYLLFPAPTDAPILHPTLDIMHP